MVWVLTFSFVLLGCGAENERLESENNPLPEKVQGLGEVSIFSLEEQLADADTVELIKEAVFESNEEVYMVGYTGEVAIDDKNRVYVVSSIPGTVHAYVFEPDGTFISKFMQEGRGPGEAEAIGSMKIKGKEVYLLAPRLQKYLIFSVDDFSLIKDEVIRRDGITDQKFSTLRARDLYVDDNRDILLSFQSFSLSDSVNQIYFHQISDNGQVVPENLFRQKKYHIHTHKLGMQDGPPIDFPMVMPFSRSSLFDISDKIYDMWTDDFLIKIYDLNGEYLRSIYYPFEKAAFDLKSSGLPEDRIETARNEEIPADWPAIHDFFVDDEDLIWVATITESDSAYQWYVLENQGGIKASFTFPGNRVDRSPMISRELPTVKNGYFYTRERDLSEGIDRIVKYKIEFKSTTSHPSQNHQK